MRRNSEPAREEITSDCPTGIVTLPQLGGRFVSSGRSSFEPPYSAVLSTSVAVACAVGALILLMVPLPALVVDLLLAANLAGATGLLLMAILTPRPVELSTLPSMIVLSSLARVLLALAVARLVVTSGHAGYLAVTLAEVAGLNNPAASLGSLLTLAVVQFVVVTAGVTRLAEVAARFALDALPGKQLIMESAGRAKAEASAPNATGLEREANFYGAMDGAARFLRGETIAVVAIVALTPLVRLAATGLQGGAWPELALTVAGHGLVILVPALLVGAAAAIVVARASATSGLTEEVGQQLFGSPVLIFGVALACLVLALVPGVAKLPLLAVAVGLAVWGWFLAVRSTEPAAETAAQIGATETPSSAVAPQVQLGWGLLDLVEEGERPLLDELTRLRDEMSADLGFSLPAFVVTDSEKLQVDQYQIVFRGSVLGSGYLRLSRKLVTASRAELLPDDGVVVKLPDGRYGKWLRAEQTQRAYQDEVSVLDPVQLLLAHLRWLLRAQAARFFDTQRASELIERLRVTHQAVVAEARAAGLSGSMLAEVGRKLLGQGIPLGDPVALVEALTAGLKRGAGSDELANMARRRMSAVITQMVAPNGTVGVITLAPAVERKLLEVQHESAGELPILEPGEAECWRLVLEDLIAQHRLADRPMVLLCAPQLRPVLAELAEVVVPSLIVLAPDELAAETEVDNLHTITLKKLAEVRA